MTKKELKDYIKKEIQSMESDNELEEFLMNEDKLSRSEQNLLKKLAQRAIQLEELKVTVRKLDKDLKELLEKARPILENSITVKGDIIEIKDYIIGIKKAGAKNVKGAPKFAQGYKMLLEEVDEATRKVVEEIMEQTRAIYDQLPTYEFKKTISESISSKLKDYFRKGIDKIKSLMGNVESLKNKLAKINDKLK